MLPGPTIIKQCPECSGCITQETIVSGNTIGAVIWTDGKMEAPMLPQEDYFVKCPYCHVLAWIDDFEEIDSIEPHEFIEERYPEAKAYLLPEFEEYIGYVDRTGCTREEEAYLRQKAWQQGNDPRRYKREKKPLSQQEQDNLWALFRLLNVTGEANDRLMNAEILRELGDFSGAMMILETIDEPRISGAVESIKALIKERNPFVENLDPESRKYSDILFRRFETALNTLQSAMEENGDGDAYLDSFGTLYETAYSLYLSQRERDYGEKEKEEHGEFIEALSALGEQLDKDGMMDRYGDLVDKVIELSAEFTIIDAERSWAQTEMRLWAWADKYRIPPSQLPRDRDALIALTELSLFPQDIITPMTDVNELIEMAESEEEELPFSLPPELFELTQLEKLEVSLMGLTHLPEEIEKLQNLTELRLPFNQLETIPSAVGKLEHLATLELKMNRLKEIPVTLVWLDKLTHLDIIDNPLILTRAQAAWLEEIAQDGCEVLWDKERCTVLDDDEEDNEDDVRNFIEMMGGEEAFLEAIKKL
ncbi:MAG: leucine-rich repeat domain-containing protein [Sulfurovum sp.]|nr:leucine-rich repeat domain-containing protein [Sulfurovum sp.]MDD3602626.1 leucine-rich repeat domain-containing protein [Sulfurovum sp.]